MGKRGRERKKTLPKSDLNTCSHSFPCSQTTILFPRSTKISRRNYERVERKREGEGDGRKKGIRDKGSYGENDFEKTTHKLR